MHLHIKLSALLSLPLFVACPGPTPEPPPVDPAAGLEIENGGASLGVHMKDYWAFTLGGVGEGHLDDRVFLPIPAGTDDDGDGKSVGAASVTLAADEGFALPLFVWIGETYTDEAALPDDDPAIPPKDDFLSMDILVELDGEPIIDSTKGEHERFFFEPVTFDEVIPYETPTEYGADGAVFVKGIGVIHKPLSPGEHTLHLDEFYGDFGIGFDNTWTITVE